MTSSKLIRFGVIGVVLSTALALLLAPISLGNAELSRTLEDTFHVPLFALVAVAALICIKPGKHEPRFKHYCMAFGAAICIGMAGELAQLLLTSTRHAQWQDVLMDACGATIGLCLHAARSAASSRRNHRKMLLAVATVVFALALAPVASSCLAYLQRSRKAPDLFTLETSAGRHFLYASGSSIKPTMVPTEWDVGADKLALLVVPAADGRWPGIMILEPWPDWRTYSQLEIDVINPHYDALTLFLRIDDRAHNQEFTDRFNRRLDIAPHQRVRIRIPLSAVQQAPATRQLNMGEIANLVLFADSELGAHAFYLCGMRLLP